MLYTLPTLIQYSQSNKARREQEDSNQKVRIQSIPIWDDIILYLKDTKNTTKNLLDLKNIVRK
jgi:hypothetical protein